MVAEDVRAADVRIPLNSSLVVLSATPATISAAIEPRVRVSALVMMEIKNVVESVAVTLAAIYHFIWVLVLEVLVILGH